MARRITVIASMRNEGAFIVEWIAWYRALGFTDAVIVTNDCTDHSPQLLTALSQGRRIHHLPITPPPGRSITKYKLAAAKLSRPVRWSEWAFVCDVDEFLVIHKGTGRIEELIGPEGSPPPFAAMSLNWRVFGTAGVESFQDIPVHQQFFIAKDISDPLSSTIKTLFRKPLAFQKLSDHAPRGWLAGEGVDMAGEWGVGDNLWVNSTGQVVESFSPLAPVFRLMPENRTSYEVAQINHYMLRSVETFSLKSGTKSPMAQRDRYSPAYFKAADSGNRLDKSALRMIAAFEVEHARLMALPGVARLHALCCADHLRLIAEKHGRDPAADPRIADYLARAAAMENGAPD
jgi:hypothetical protein